MTLSSVGSPIIERGRTKPMPWLPAEGKDWQSLAGEKVSQALILWLRTIQDERILGQAERATAAGTGNKAA